MMIFAKVGMLDLVSRDGVMSDYLDDLSSGKNHTKFL